MPNLSPEPNTSEFRKHLDDFLKAVEEGQDFTLFNYKTAIGKIAQPSKLPKAFKARAEKVPFTEVRDESSLLRKKLMKGEAIIITKQVRGPATTPKIGRRPMIVRDVKEIAAVWPLQEGIAITALLEMGRKHSRMIEELVAQFQKLGSVIQPMAEKIEILASLDEAIAQKRQVADNLDKTIRRVATVS